MNKPATKTRREILAEMDRLPPDIKPCFTAYSEDDEQSSPAFEDHWAARQYGYAQLRSGAWQWFAVEKRFERKDNAED